MSDFDFDELDKAVAGVLKTDEPAVTTPTSSPSLSSSSTQSETVSTHTSPMITSSPAASPTDASTTSQPAPATRRSSGRFMDVVHPSSDMRTSSAPINRPVTSEPSSFVSPVSQAPAVEQATPQATERSAEEEFEASWTAPLESPFLPDAKVEKRPLGSAFPTGAADASTSKNDELLLEESDELPNESTTMPDPLDFAGFEAQEDATPASNSPTDATENADESLASDDAQPVLIKDEPEIADLPALEEKGQGNDTPIDLETTAADLNAIEDRNLDLIVPTPISIETEESEPKKDTPAEASAPVAPMATGPTSITQQYEEKPQTEQASGAIYDTENYHRPVAPPATKSHGAWSIVWIILLVILGAGAGVAFYLFVLPML